ncbi:hypothetical protein RF11_02705 [Thelohanellus kitauei]|uniref:Uncharacterized protein n=1 Tax=Thelohanellus kitauei TaxID=669202 RepID=A0A0C2MLQ1_THEKT|nr:hypothetical protein RF11_02705 [Thelohanellus kitauei]
MFNDKMEILTTLIHLFDYLYQQRFDGEDNYSIFFDALNHDYSAIILNNVIGLTIHFFQNMTSSYVIFTKDLEYLENTLQDFRSIVDIFRIPGKKCFEYPVIIRIYVKDVVNYTIIIEKSHCCSYKMVKLIPMHIEKN